MNSTSPPAYRVALLLETSREVGRALLRGIQRYARLHGPWSLHVLPGDLVQTLPAMRAWRGTGIIARIATPQISRAIVNTGLPVIAGSLSSERLIPAVALARLPEIRGDGEAIGRMAAEHFLERGFRNFGFVGTVRDEIWVQRRRKAFADRLAAAGVACVTYSRPPSRERDWGREQKRLARWLTSLPRPAAVMAALDARGRQVIEACMEANLRVPQDIAVLGVDNDELLCELCDPPLSSIHLNAEKAGYEAAALLHRMMQGEAVRRQIIAIEPTHIVPRKSTDVVALGDEKISAAVEFIRLAANKPLQVSAVAERVELSRRALELRFRKALGHTVLTEIRRVQLERVRRFLLETDLSIDRIAIECGFATGNYLGKVFRRQFKQTPQRFRLQNREVATV